jgi:hypothetical protein
MIALLIVFEQEKFAGRRTRRPIFAAHARHSRVNVKTPPSLHFTKDRQAALGSHVTRRPLSTTRSPRSDTVLRSPSTDGSDNRGHASRRLSPTDCIVRLTRCRDVPRRLGSWDSGGRPLCTRSDRGRTVCAQRSAGDGASSWGTVEVIVEPSIELETAAPEPSRVLQLARQAVQALRAAQEHVRLDAESVRSERERIVRERERLTQSETQLAEQRLEFETQLADIVKMTADIERQTAAVDATRKQLEDDAQALTQGQEECKAGQARLAEQEQRQAAAAKILAERENGLAQAERELENHLRSLEPRKRQLEQQEQELTAQRRQVDAQAAELDETRKTLAAMQAQLTRDHQEIAVQRDTLLERLGSVARVAPAPAESLRVGIAGEPVSAHATPVRGPKPAALPADEQFRKLRRDAKRKAIGV